MLRPRFIAVVAVAAAPIVMTVGAASAAPRPSVSFAFAHHARINAGTSPVVSIHLAHAPRSAKLLVQRQMGTGKVWGKVASAPARSGKVSLPKAAMSRSAYRIQMVRGSRVVATSADRVLTAYGNIAMPAFCSTFLSEYNTSCRNGTRSVDGKLWTYNAKAFTEDGRWVTDFRATRGTTCRALTLSWVQEGSTGLTSYLRNQQTTSDEEDASGPSSTINTFVFHLDGGPFTLAGTNPSRDDQDLYMNGTASCYTADGKLP